MIPCKRRFTTHFTGQGSRSWLTPIARDRRRHLVVELQRTRALDGKAFDAWTRRRLNLAIGGAGLSVLLGTLVSTTAEGKKRKGKKKKATCAKKTGERCTKKLPCCKGKGFACLPNAGNPTGPSRCCKVGLQSCSVDADCCGNSCVDGACACKTDGQECAGIGTICCSLKCQVTGEDTSQCVS